MVLLINMRKLIIFFLLLFLFFNLLPRIILAENVENAYDEAKKCYIDVKTDAQKINEPGRWHACISLFKNIAARYPKSKTASAAIYSAARLHKELYQYTNNIEEVNEAIHLYNRIVREYPRSSFADDALFQIGQLRHDPLKDDERAKRAYQAVIERYPKGDMASMAKAKLKSLEGEHKIEQTDDLEKKESLLILNRGEEAKKDEEKNPFRIAKLLSYDVDIKDSQTLVVFNLDEAVPFTRKFVDYGLRTKSPPQLTLYFHRTKMTNSVEKDMNISSPHLESIKIKKGVFSGQLKVNLKLKRNITYKIVQKNRKVFVYLFSEGDSSGALRLDEQATYNKNKEGKRSNFRKPRIVIDPGHGGNDKGAIGSNGIEEKRVTLEISKKLADILERRLGANVYLTRSNDKNLDLEKRIAFANSRKADIFVSIHANAVADKNISGIETYYLDNSTDEAAKRLAERENRAALKPKDEVDRILLTLFQNYNTEESQKLAYGIHKTVISNIGKKYPNVKNRGVRSALFYVLVGVKCPGVLFEASYLSNPLEEKRLISSKYQMELASSIAMGLKQYIENSKELASNL